MNCIRTARAENVAPDLQRTIWASSGEIRNCESRPARDELRRGIRPVPGWPQNRAALPACSTAVCARRPASAANPPEPARIDFAKIAFCPRRHVKIAGVADAELELAGAAVVGSW
jgi:hypothetical protein